MIVVGAIGRRHQRIVLILTVNSTVDLLIIVTV